MKNYDLSNALPTVSIPRELLNTPLCYAPKGVFEGLTALYNPMCKGRGRAFLKRHYALPIKDFIVGCIRTEKITLV